MIKWDFISTLVFPLLNTFIAWKFRIEINSTIAVIIWNKWTRLTNVGYTKQHTAVIISKELLKTKLYKKYPNENTSSDYLRSTNMGMIYICWFYCGRNLIGFTCNIRPMYIYTPFHLRNICSHHLKKVHSNPVLTYNKWFLKFSKQESPPAGNRTRHTARSVTCPVGGGGGVYSSPVLAGEGYPTPVLVYPHGQHWVPPHPAGTGVPPGQEWGTPTLERTWDWYPSPRRWTDWKKKFLPHPSDAGGNKTKSWDVWFHWIAAKAGNRFDVCHHLTEFTKNAFVCDVTELMPRCERCPRFKQFFLLKLITIVWKSRADSDLC